MRHAWDLYVLPSGSGRSHTSVMWRLIFDAIDVASLACVCVRSTILMCVAHTLRGVERERSSRAGVCRAYRVDRRICVQCGLCDVSGRA